MKKILGFALLAVVAWLVLKLAFGILGTLIGLAFTVLMLAAVGWVIYMVIKLIAPRTAGKISDRIVGLETKLSETPPLTTEPEPRPDADRVRRS
jgi:hypothetical protein